jgi:ABC-type sugar transport system substrate-binding protein
MMADALNEAMGRRVSTSSYPAIHSDSKPSVPTAIALDRTRRRMYMGIGIAAILLALVLVVAALLPAVSTPRIILPTVMKGQTASAADSEPTSNEIARAQARLGDNGFIAYIACNQTSQFHAAQAREVGEFATRYSLSSRVYDGNNNKATEISQIERARTDGAIGLIVCPLDVETLSDTLRSVQQAGMPLVMMSSEAETFGGVLIAGDNHLMGLEAGRAAGQIIRDEMGGHADVIILDYPDLKYIVSRADGMEAGVLEAAPEAHIIGRYLGATADNGQQSVSHLIAESIHFDVILSINDAGSYGAIAAMEAAEIDPDSVIISSVDAESVARDYIRGGHYMRASVDVGRHLFSQTAVNTMVKLLAGSTVPEIYLVPPGEVVTRDTLVREAIPEN